MPDADDAKNLRLLETLANFQEPLRANASTMTVKDRQAVLRRLVK